MAYCRRKVRQCLRFSFSAIARGSVENRWKIDFLPDGLVRCEVVLSCGNRTNKRPANTHGKRYTVTQSLWTHLMKKITVTVYILGIVFLPRRTPVVLKLFFFFLKKTNV